MPESATAAHPDVLPDLMTLEQAADVLGVSLRFLFNERQAGRLRATTLSRKCVRISREDLNAYIRSAS